MSTTPTATHWGNYDVVAEGGRVVDLLPAFAGIDPRSLWVSPGDAHANARAHEIIGRTLYDALMGVDEQAGLGTRGHQSTEDRHE